MKKYLLFLVLAAAGIFCGCQYTMDNPFFEVKESGLNWLDINYFNYRRRPITRVYVRIDGNGLVDVREGASSLVSNDFAANTKDEHWDDIRQTRVSIPREEACQLFQMLVDSGLFKERYKWNNEIHTNEAIFATANINNKTCGSQDDIYTTDPDLAEHLKNVVLMFYHPSPRRRTR